MQAAQHAIYSPSSSHRWSRCTASATAIDAAGIALDLADGADEEGQEAHAEIERCLAPLAAGGAALPANPDHSAAYGISLLLKYVAQLPPGRLWIEQRVELTKDVWGRCDVSHFHETTGVLTIVDYKNGYVNVEAQENEQTRIYGGASIFQHCIPAKYVRYVIVQPNSFMPVPRVKQWIEPTDPAHPVDPTWIKPREPFQQFLQRIAGIPAGKLEFIAGEHCRYCPLFGQCPASKDVLAAFTAAIVNPPDKVRPEQVAPFLACEKPIADWFKALDKSVTKAALAGAAIPGMKLVATTKHRAWIDEAEARKVVVGQCGDAALDLCTPSQAEKLGVDVSKLSAAPPGGPALAFESDKRKPFERKSAAEMFSSVTGAK